MCVCVYVSLSVHKGMGGGLQCRNMLPLLMHTWLITYYSLHLRLNAHFNHTLDHALYSHLRVSRGNSVYQPRRQTAHIHHPRIHTFHLASQQDTHLGTSRIRAWNHLHFYPCIHSAMSVLTRVVFSYRSDKAAIRVDHHRPSSTAKARATQIDERLLLLV